MSLAAWLASDAQPWGPLPPYLFAPAPAAPALKHPDDDSLRIGLAWQGNPDFPHDAQRSIPDAAVLAPLLAVPGTRWVSLHKDGAATLPGLEPPGIALHDFGDTAAVMDTLDLVVCVDTAVAHLAGAMGIPCWVMLPGYMTDWRWMRDRNDTPWYPSLTLCRQATPGDWAGVVSGLVGRLQAPGAAQAIRSLRRPQTSA